jgi:TatD DNase family protein
MYIDSHAHLFGKDFANDLHETVERAREARVEYIIVPGVDERTSREAVELAEKYDFIRACVGFHPHEAHRVDNRLMGEIEALSDHKRVVAIGEIGLDYHYDFSPRDKQVAVFREQIDLAVRKNLPIVVHTRESLTETTRVVGDMVRQHAAWNPGKARTLENNPAARGVFHCFTGSALDAAGLFESGFFVSYPGMVTFKNSSAIGVLKQVGCENILLETDSPYMAPVPFRGRRNEPANIVHIGKFIAASLNMLEAEVARLTSRNSRLLFNLNEPA